MDFIKGHQLLVDQVLQENISEADELTMEQINLVVGILSKVTAFATNVIWILWFKEVKHDAYCIYTKLAWYFQLVSYVIFLHDYKWLLDVLWPKWYVVQALRNLLSGSWFPPPPPPALEISLLQLLSAGFSSIFLKMFLICLYEPTFLFIGLALWRKWWVWLCARPFWYDELSFLKWPGEFDFFPISTISWGMLLSFSSVSKHQCCIFTYGLLFFLCKFTEPEKVRAEKIPVML